MDNIFGRALLQRRLALGMTGLTLSQLTGLSRSYINKVERGDVTPPLPDNIGKLAVALGLSPDAFTALADKIPSDVHEALCQHYDTMLPVIRAMHRLSDSDRVLIQAFAESLVGEDSPSISPQPAEDEPCSDAVGNTEPAEPS